MASFENGLALVRQWEAMDKRNLDEARAQREDAWLAQQRARYQKDWEQQDRANAVGDAEYQKFLGRAPDQTFDVGSAFGIQRPAPVAPVDGAAPSGGMGMDPQQAGKINAASAGLAPPTARPQSENRRIAQSKATLAGASRDWKAFYDAQSEDAKARIADESAQIADYITNLSPQDRAAYAEKVTNDKRNKYEATVDQKTGYTTIKLGDKTAQLSPVQLGQWFAAKHRLKNGDYGAMAELEGIDKNLAATVAAEFGQLKDMAGVNNTANHFGRTDAETRRHNMATEKTAAEHYNKPDFATLENDKGEAVMVDKRTLKVGPDGQVALPQGLRLPRKRPEIDQMAVAKAMSELTGEDAKLPFAQRYSLVVNALYGKGTGGSPDWKDLPTSGPGRSAAPQAPAPQQYDSDGMPIPMRRDLQGGYATPLDAAGLLRTPNYRVSPNTFKPD